MTKSKLTPAVAKTITRDWQSLVPQFGTYKPMKLARLVGPLVQGVSLDRDSSGERYRPTLFAHCLCRPFDVLTLSLSQRLLAPRSGAEDRVSVQSHESRFREACERLMQSSVLPTTGDLSIGIVVRAYDEYLRVDAGARRVPFMLMEDAVAVCAWLGEDDRAQRLASKYANEAQAVAANYGEAAQGFPAWCEGLKELARATERLRQITTEQIASHRLQGLPTAQLTV